MMKKVTTIITTYHGSDNLTRAVESVLNQTYSCLEIIVVDDNPPESAARTETERIMEKYAVDSRVKYIKHSENMNGSAARNTGLNASTGEYIQLLDDDDWLFSQKFERSLWALHKYPKCDCVVTGVIAYGSVGVADLSGAKEENGDFIISREWLYRFNALGTGSNIFATRESIMKINGFDVSYPRMQDIEFVFRYCKEFKVCAIPDRLIVKALNDRPIKINSYQKHTDVVNKFIGQFKDEIVNLIGEEATKKWLSLQYDHLFRLALADGDKTYIQVARNYLERYRKLTLLEKTKATFPKIWVLIRNNQFLRSLRRRKKKV